MFSVGRLLYIMVPPLDLFEFLYWILAIFTPFLGGAAQVDSIQTRLECAPGVRHQRLKLECEELLSNVAFSFNLRRYTAT